MCFIFNAGNPHSLPGSPVLTPPQASFHLADNPMANLLKIFALLFMVGSLAQAQSKEETMAFLQREIKSFETRTFHVTEAYFSEGGAVFTYRRVRTGKPEKNFTIPLNQVDIYVRKRRHADGVDTFTVLVRSRGRDGYFKVGGHNFHGTKVLFGRMDNETKAQSIAAAFTRLTALAADRSNPFAKP